MNYDLRAAIERTLADTAITAPQAIAAEVAAAVPAEHLRSVLAEALASHVRVHLTTRRTDNPILAGASANTARSAKVAAIRATWQSALRDRIHVGDGKWLLLGACGYGELMFAAAERRQNAERSLAKAEQFTVLAEQLRAHGAATVADLPTSALAVALPKAA